jgi:hypothetical protein
VSHEADVPHAGILHENSDSIFFTAFSIASSSALKLPEFYLLRSAALDLCRMINPVGGVPYDLETLDNPEVIVKEDSGG